MKKRKLLGKEKKNLTPRKRPRLGKDLEQPKKRRRLGGGLEHKLIQKKRKCLGESERGLVKQPMKVLICCPQHFNQETRVPEQLCEYMSVREGKCYGCTSWQEPRNRIITGYGRKLIKPKGRRRLG